MEGRRRFWECARRCLEAAGRYEGEDREAVLRLASRYLAGYFNG